MIEYTHPCHYRGGGARCVGGFLCLLENGDVTIEGSLVPKGIAIEGVHVRCSVCDGTGRLLTDDGRNFMIFLKTYLRPMIFEMIEEAIEAREG